MSACPQCGAAARPTDRFCNACGTPIARASTPAAPAGPAYGAPAPPPFSPPGFGTAAARPTPARCQMGHEIVGGTSYCAQGHPIALEQMQFAADPFAGAATYAAPPGQTPYAAPPGPTPYAPTVGPYGGAPPLPPLSSGGGFGAPQAPPSAVGGPPGGYGAAPAPVPYGDPPRDAVPARALRGFLVAYGTNASGDFWPLTGGRLTIGRLGSTDRLDIALQDPTISSHHAAMVVDAAAGTVAVEDTGSTNGTFVNDEHIGFNGRRDLRDGDRLRFGAFTTIVKIIGRV